MVRPLHHTFDKKIRTVAVIGAGPSGVSVSLKPVLHGELNRSPQVPATKHLKDAGFKVRLLERQNAAGGVWSWSPDLPLPSSIPTPPPSIGDFQPHLASASGSTSQHKSAAEGGNDTFNRRKLLERELEDPNKERLVEFSPPNPVYWSLHNNVPTPNMEVSSYPSCLLCDWMLTMAPHSSRTFRSRKVP